MYSLQQNMIPFRTLLLMSKPKYKRRMKPLGELLYDKLALTLIIISIYELLLISVKGSFQTGELIEEGLTFFC